MFAFLITVSIISFWDLIGNFFRLKKLAWYEKTKRTAIYFNLPLSALLFTWSVILWAGML